MAEKTTKDRKQKTTSHPASVMTSDPTVQFFASLLHSLENLISPVQQINQILQNMTEYDSLQTKAIRFKAKTLQCFSKNVSNPILVFILKIACLSRIQIHRPPDLHLDRIFYHRALQTSNIFFPAPLPIPLVRAANLLKAFFHIYRGYTSFGSVEEVRDGEDKNVLNYTRSDFFEITKAGRFVWAGRPFRKIQGEGESCERKLDAIVSTHECFNVVAFLAPVINTVFEGLCIKLEAVPGTPKNITLTTNEEMPFLDQIVTRGPSEEHWVIRLTIRSGQIFALDLTSAQYGWYEILTNWDRYVYKRFDKHNPPILLKDVRALWDRENLQLGIYMAAASQAEDHVIRAVYLSLKEEMRKEMTEWSMVLGLDEKEYETKVFEMLLSAVMRMENVISMFKKKGMYFWYEDQAGNLLLTRTAKEASTVGVLRPGL